MDDQKIADDLVAKLKQRDQQDQVTVDKAKHEQDMKQKAGQSTFTMLAHTIEKTAAAVSSAMARPVVQFQDQTGGGFRLVGQQSKNHIIDVRLIPNTGVIAFDIISGANDKRTGSFEPKVSGNAVNFYNGSNLVTIDQMCTYLLEVITGFREAR